MANPTIVLLPVWGVGHFMPMIEAGKRMLQCSSRALSLTVLLMPAPTAQAASDIAAHVRREEDGGIDIRFHHLPHVQLPTDHTGIEEFISRIVQLHVPHIGAAISDLTCPVAALVVDIFCTPALDVSRELAVPAYVYFTSSAALLALLLRSPSLHEEVEVEFEEMEGAVDVPGLPPVPPSFLPRTMLDRKIPTYTWFVLHREALHGSRWHHRQHCSGARAGRPRCDRRRPVHARSPHAYRVPYRSSNLDKPADD
jgi:hypothetical protein